MLNILTDDQKETLYLSYVNDFLTVERFAEYWGLTYAAAFDIIEEQRKRASK